MPDRDKFRLIRLTKPEEILSVPRGLFGQIDGLGESGVDIVCSGDFLLDNLTWFVVLCNRLGQICGFFWFFESELEQRTVLYAVSLDKRYQRFRNEMQKWMFDYIRDTGAKKVVCETTSPRALERYGWKRSQRVLMEFDL